MVTENQDKQLVSLLRSARAVPHASAREKAVSAMAAAADLRNSAGALGQTCWQRLKLKRVLIAAAVGIVLVAPALWLTSHRGPSAALANMARAMAKVQSAHFTGVSLDSETGNYVPIECWVKGPTKLRLRTDGLEDEIHDGESRVVINFSTTPTIVRISSESMPDPAMAVGLSYLNLFRGEIALERMDMDNAQITSEEVTLPDGRAATVVEAVAGEERNVFTIAADTDLLISWESYHNGILRHKVRQIEYNIEIPDSVFAAKIPQGAIVVDRRVPASSAPEQPGRVPPAQAASAEEPILIGVTSGSCGSAFHTRLHFKVISGPATIVYLPNKNAYRVQGEVRVWGLGVDRVVKNTDFIAPAPPDMTVEQWREQQAEFARELARLMPPPEVQAQREAKRKELVTAGAKGLGTTGGMYSISGLSFEVLNNQMISVWYLPSRGEFYVMGKALVHRGDFSRIVEDGWVKVPGPPPELPEEAN